MSILRLALCAPVAAAVLGAAAPAVAQAPDCKADNAKVILDGIKQNGLDLIAGRYYRFKGSDVACLEQAGLIETTNRAIGNTDDSYAQVFAKFISFSPGITEEELALSPGNFLSGFLTKRRRATVLSAKVRHGGEVIQETPLFGVHFDERGGRKATVKIYPRGPLSPWIPLNAADSVSYSLYGYETKAVDFTFISSIVAGIQRAASFQAGPTKFLSTMTRPAVVAAAKEIEAHLSANNNRKLDIDAEINLDFLGPDRDEAGIFFELTDKQGRPAAAIMIFTRYKKSMLTDATMMAQNALLPDFRKSEPTTLITTNALGALGMPPGQRNPLEYLMVENATLLDGIENENPEAFSSACTNLSALLSSRAGLKRYDHAAMVWAFLHWEKSAWAMPAVRRGSACPNPFLLAAMRDTLKLKTYADADTTAVGPVMDQDVSLATSAIVQTFTILHSNMEPAQRRNVATEILKQRLPEMIVDDQQGVSGAIIAEERKTARNAVTQVFERLAARFDDAGCSTSARAITERQNSQASAPKAGYVLLATGAQAPQAAYAGLHVEFGATSATTPALSLRSLTEEEALAARIEYGCTAEMFPLTADFR